MLGEPQTEIDVTELFGPTSACTTDYVSIFQEEFSTIFGPMGTFIIKKQVEDITKGQDITEDRLPFIIDQLSESVVSVVGPDAARDLKKQIKRRCGIPV